MNQSEFYAAWVAALRSGEYEQGAGALRMGDSYCCLGVACDISSLNSDWGGEWVYSSSQPVGFKINGESRDSVLPSRLEELLGMDEVGTFNFDHDYWDSKSGRMYYGFADLTTLNDGSFTFSQIADVIEYFFAPKSM